MVLLYEMTLQSKCFSFLLSKEFVTQLEYSGFWYEVFACIHTWSGTSSKSMKRKKKTEKDAAK